ncbi:MAG: type II toxin-antitoxin system VapC family toxin [Deltaproteobacteria bacterium]|nr:type II toxin-antitoxin system VapC family toxin [Deltaproteobacteria bacterium]
MSRLLLDTHTLLWWETGELDKRVIKRLQNADEVYVSAASLWEITIKKAIGKLVVERTLRALVDDNGFLALPIDVPHLESLDGLPLHHRDPFDRLLVAQARSERLRLVSNDPLIALYDVDIVWS